MRERAAAWGPVRFENKASSRRVARALNDSIPNITRARARFMAKIELRLYNKDQITRLTSTREAGCARDIVFAYQRRGSV